jgi:hypothetical protein
MNSINRKTYPTDLTDAQWAILEPLSGIVPGATYRSCDELKLRQAEIADLKKQREEFLNRRDWLLLMKFNRLPGVALIKRAMRWMLDRS